MEYVSWYDAVEFCNKLSSQNGIAAYYHLVNVTRNDGSISSADVTISGGPGYRLPTEAEWEYACRAGSMTPFHFGDVCNGSEANVDGDNPFGTRTKGASLKRTTTVGSYLANSFGLLDMHGNVWEWCFDVADVSAYAGRGYTTIDPVKATGGKARILRGGSWHYRPMSSAFRADALPAKRGDALGFRVVYAGVKTQ